MMSEWAKPPAVNDDDDNGDDTIPLQEGKDDNNNSGLEEDRDTVVAGRVMIYGGDNENDKEKENEKKNGHDQNNDNKNQNDNDNNNDNSVSSDKWTMAKSRTRPDPPRLLPSPVDATPAKPIEAEKAVDGSGTCRMKGLMRRRIDELSGTIPPLHDATQSSKRPQRDDLSLTFRTETVGQRAKLPSAKVSSPINFKSLNASDTDDDEDVGSKPNLT